MDLKRIFGWIPQPADARDRLFSARPVAAVEPPSFPERIDLRPNLPPVWDQGQIGSCTAHAVMAAAHIADPRTFVDEPGSRLFLYWYGRAALGRTEEDCGAVIRDVIKAAVKVGIPPETLWPYEPRRLFTEPTPEVRERAETRQALEYLAVNTARVAEMKACLRSLTPFVFGMELYPSFLHPDGDGVVPNPEDRWGKEDAIGGHALLCCGFQDRNETQGRWPEEWGPGLWLVRNSWGKTWGKQGYCWLTTRHMTTFARDAWALLDFEEPLQP